jgi:hypothetical protein
MADIDEAQVRETFERVNEVLAGREMGVCVAALQDLLAAVICWSHGDKASALKFGRAVGVDIRCTIQKNFDHYNDPATAMRRNPNAH